LDSFYQKCNNLKWCSYFNYTTFLFLPLSGPADPAIMAVRSFFLITATSRMMAGITSSTMAA